jgi:hypothetical protein
MSEGRWAAEASEEPAFRAMQPRDFIVSSETENLISRS